MTGRRIAAVRTAAGGLTAAALLASSACSHSKSHSASGSAAATVARFGFTVDDTFANNLTWHYDSGLNLVQGPNGTPVVHWNSSVIQPLLGPTALLKAVPPPQTVTDATGTQIDTTK